MKRTLSDRADAIPALAEVFRENGFEGASLSMISKATGLGKGSLYNFFPGGKEEMMAAVLDHIDRWFVTAVFAPLEEATDPSSAITSMVRDVEIYFRSGGRVCLVGLVGLSAARDPFAKRIKEYFHRWVSALTQCLETAHVPPEDAARLAEAAVAGIQGAITLSRALNDLAVFTRIVRRDEARLLDALSSSHRR